MLYIDPKQKMTALYLLIITNMTLIDYAAIDRLRRDKNLCLVRIVLFIQENHAWGDISGSIHKKYKYSKRLRW